MSIEHDIEYALSCWTRALRAGNFEKLAELYTADALFIGAAGKSRGRQGILDYLKAHGSNAAFRFRELDVQLLDCDVVLAAVTGDVSFDSAAPRGFRFLQTYVWTNQGWRIAGHHGSYGA